MPDDDDDDFYYYYSSDPPIDNDEEGKTTEETSDQTDSEPAPSRTITPISYSSPTKRGKSLPRKILKGTFMVLGYAFLAAVLLVPTKNNNKK